MEPAKNREPGPYTYEDYESWPENAHIELIDGFAYRYGQLITGDIETELEMHATPATAHQAVSMDLSAQLYQFLDGKPCKVFPAPFSVNLTKTQDKKIVLEPDISVLCDLSGLDEKGYNGAPDMVVEILSPSTARYDRLVKLNLYRQAGVKEYWIVDPQEQIVQVNLLTDSQYAIHMYSEGDVIPVQVLDGCTIDAGKMFSA